MKYNPTPRFTITYDIITEASAVHGDSAYNGFMTRGGNTPRRRNYIPAKPAKWTLREAVETLRDHGDHFEADSCPATVCRWVTAYPSDSQWRETGESVTLSLHLPRGISNASARRVSRVLARELNVYGLAK
jgi:hypothetical protein